VSGDRSGHPETGFEQAFVHHIGLTQGRLAQEDGAMETSRDRISTAISNVAEMVVASARYLDTLGDLSDDDMRAPSLLPGWTRGHVVTHLARNADAFCNLLQWAETGRERYMYESPERRDADIGEGAGRAAHELRLDASASAGRLLQRLNELDVDHEDNPVARAPGTPTFPGREIATHRWVEVEVHHADLRTGYGPEDWDPTFADLLVTRVGADRAEGPAMVLRSADTGGLWKYGVPGQGPTVEGRACDLAWWVLGRGDGAGLTSDAGVLPELARWR
jgi:maleylpyruvate isomerase